MANKGHVHGFAAYNKFDSQGALIGNYYEERSLDEATGHHRYPKWIKPEQPGTETIYATHTGCAPPIETFPRVIEHTDRLDSGEWMTQCQDTYRVPLGRPDLDIKNVTLPKMGKREAMELQRLYAEAATLPEPEKHQHRHDTEQRTQYIPIDLTGMKIGATVMQTQDRTEDVTRDPTFLAEQELIPKGTVDRMMPGDHMRTTLRPSYMGATAETDATAAGDDEVPYYEDHGISLYSDAVHTDTYRGTSMAHGTKITSATRPFAKNCDFSKPLGEYNKVVTDE